MADENINSNQFEKLCAGYVLGALSDDERRQFEQMLDDATNEQKKLYRELRSTSNQLAFSVEREVPSDAVKEQLMTKVRGDSDISPGVPTDAKGDEFQTEDDEEDSFNWSALSAAASFALLIVSLSLLFYSFNLSSEINDREQTITDQETTITELKNELQQKEEMLAVLGARDVDLIMMSGLEVNPDGYGKVLWDPKKQQALLQVSNLPPVPSDKDYQLWLIHDNKPVSAGVFAVRNSGSNLFKIEKMADADKQSAKAFAITMEPKGGMPQPTGDMYLLGDMGEESN